MGGPLVLLARRGEALGIVALGVVEHGRQTVRQGRRDQGHGPGREVKSPVVEVAEGLRQHLINMEAYW
jgi:hypothetical protein